MTTILQSLARIPSATATIDWEGIPCWIASFSAVWREPRVPRTSLRIAGAQQLYQIKRMFGKRSATCWPRPILKLLMCTPLVHVITPRGPSYGKQKNGDEG